MLHATDRFDLPGTEKTPHLTFDLRTGRLALQGCSIPENADRFYNPVFDTLDRYAQAPAARTLVRIELTYFNSSSAKYLLDILKRLEDLHMAGSSQVALEWVHADGDLDMKEAGQDFRSLLEFPVKVVQR